MSSCSLLSILQQLRITEWDITLCTKFYGHNLFQSAQHRQSKQHDVLREIGTGRAPCLMAAFHGTETLVLGGAAGNLCGAADNVVET